MPGRPEDLAGGHERSSVVVSRISWDPDVDVVARLVAPEGDTCGAYCEPSCGTPLIMHVSHQPEHAYSPLTELHVC